MAHSNSNITASAWSLESNSLILSIKRAQQISPTNAEDVGSEIHSQNSGGTSSSSGTHASSHLTGFIAEIESSGTSTTTVEVDPINASASIYIYIYISICRSIEVNKTLLLYTHNY